LEAAAERQPSFWASGNGVAYRGGVVGHPTQLAPHMGPNMIRVGAHDNGYASVWSGSSPHVISDGCWSWAAENISMNESTPRTGSGTSAASPFAAGIAGKILLEARSILGDERTGVRDGVLAQGPAGIVESGPLADGVFTMQELREVLFNTADPRPEEIEEDGDACNVENTIDAMQDDPLYANYLLYLAPPVAWKDVPEGPQGIPFVGYGAATLQSAELAFEVLRGETPLPERNVEDEYFGADEEYRRTLHSVYISAP